MAKKQNDKIKIISQFRLNENDTGSVEVQVALLTAKINDLNKNHFEQHLKDYSSRRGLMKWVGQRRKLLDYLYREDAARYKKLIETLGLRR